MMDETTITKSLQHQQIVLDSFYTVLQTILVELTSKVYNALIDSKQQDFRSNLSRLEREFRLLCIYPGLCAYC